MSVKAYRKIVLTSRGDVLSADAFGPADPGLARLAAGRLAAEHTPDGVTVDGALSLEMCRRSFPATD
jgi:hypothetical protein